MLDKFSTKFLCKKIKLVNCGIQSTKMTDLQKICLAPSLRPRLKLASKQQQKQQKPRQLECTYVLKLWVLKGEMEIFYFKNDFYTYKYRPKHLVVMTILYIFRI